VPKRISSCSIRSDAAAGAPHRAPDSGASLEELLFALALLGDDRAAPPPMRPAAGAARSVQRAARAARIIACASTDDHPLTGKLMQKNIVSLKTAALAVPAMALCAVPQAQAAPSNEEATKRHFAALLSGGEPKLAELTMFMTMLPKGGDLHHHYSGAIYAEQYLEWVDKQGYCVNKQSYMINTVAAEVAAERAKPLAERNCLSGVDVMQNNTVLAQLLQRWSDKDFYNHSAIQSPPDRQFFDTFAYFGPYRRPIPPMACSA
jgi:hypothetical protein